MSKPTDNPVKICNHQFAIIFQENSRISLQIINIIAGETYIFRLQYPFNVKISDAYFSFQKAANEYFDTLIKNLEKD